MTSTFDMGLVSGTQGGRIDFRLDIEGMPHDWVTSQPFLAASGSGAKPRKLGLLRTGLTLNETILYDKNISQNNSGITFSILDLDEAATSEFLKLPSQYAVISDTLAYNQSSINVFSGSTLVSSLPTGSTAWISHEAVLLNSVSLGTGVGGSDVLYVTRGILNSYPESYYVPTTASNANNNMTIVTNSPRQIKNRRCSLFAYADGDSYASTGSQVYRGYITSDVSFAGDGTATTYTFTTDNIINVLNSDFGVGTTQLGVRGYYFPDLTPWSFVITEYSSSVPSPSVGQQSAVIFVNGKFETMNDLKNEVNAQLASKCAFVDGWRNSYLFDAIDGGGNYGLMYQTTYGSTDLRGVNVRTTNALYKDYPTSTRVPPPIPDSHNRWFEDCLNFDFDKTANSFAGANRAFYYVNTAATFPGGRSGNRIDWTNPITNVTASGNYRYLVGCANAATWPQAMANVLASWDMVHTVTGSGFHVVNPINRLYLQNSTDFQTLTLIQPHTDALGYTVGTTAVITKPGPSGFGTDATFPIFAPLTNLVVTNVDATNNFIDIAYQNSLGTETYPNERPYQSVFFRTDASGQSNNGINLGLAFGGGPVSNFLQNLIDYTNQFTDLGGNPLITADDLNMDDIRNTIALVAGDASTAPLVNSSGFSFYGKVKKLNDILAGEAFIVTCYFCMDATGRITLRPMKYPSKAQKPVMTFDSTNILTDQAFPSYARYSIGTFNSVDLHIDYDQIKDVFNKEYVVNWVDAIHRNGNRKSTVDVSVYSRRDMFAVDPPGVLNAIFQKALLEPVYMLGSPYSIVSLEAQNIYSLAVGDIVKINSNVLPNLETGTRGVTDLVGMVQSRNLDLATGFGSFDIIVFDGAGNLGYTPTAQPDIITRSGLLYTIYVEDRFFAPVGFKDLDYFKVGDKVQARLADSETSVINTGVVQQLDTSMPGLNWIKVLFDTDPGLTTGNAINYRIEFQPDNQQPLADDQQAFAFVSRNYGQEDGEYQ